MKKTILALVTCSAVWASCTKVKPLPPLTKMQIKQKVDSIMMIKNKEMEEAGKIDLNHRLKIELKVKVDSILNAENNPVKKPALHK